MLNYVKSAGPYGEGFLVTVSTNTVKYNVPLPDIYTTNKNIGEVFTGGLEKIKQLKVYNYTFKDDKDKTPRVGVIAQDLKKVFPDAVAKGEDGFLRIRWEDIFYALVNAVKELDLRITTENTALKKRVAELEKQNKDLEKRLSKLESKVFN